MIPTTHKIKVYQVTFWCDIVDEDGNVIEELQSEKADFDTAREAEKFVNDNPVGSEYGYYSDGTCCIISDIDFDYDPVEIEVFYTKAERAALEREEEQRQLLDNFKHSDLCKKDLVSIAMCLNSYISMQECKENAEMKEYLWEIIGKLNRVAGITVID